MRAHTPMLQQYFQTKEGYPGVLMAIRVGDFYEFYGEDAETAAAALEITLTGREDGPNGRIPMAGVPYHAVEKYLARLVAAGLKVALCDQIEDPKQAKGLVKRAVTRVLTPGTLVEDALLNAGQNNFLAAIGVIEGRAGLATLDPSTGEFLVTELEGDGWTERLLAELARVRPAELLHSDREEAFGETVRQGLGISVTTTEGTDALRAARTLQRQFEAHSLAGFGVADRPAAQVAAAMILSYAERNGLNLAHVDRLATYSVEGFMAIDPATRRALEITQNLAEGGRKYTLLSVLDETSTSMGARLLRRWLDQPLLDPVAIDARHDSVARLCEHSLVRNDLRQALARLADLERLVGRCATGLAGPRDLAGLRATLNALPDVDDVARRVARGRLEELRDELGDHRDLALTLHRAVVQDPPATLRDGGIIAEGFDPELDQLRTLQRGGREYIRNLEAREREVTGIASLKVGFNAVFGYYLEVGKAHTARVPEHYVRKQTTAGAERYITAELKDQESAVLGAGDKAVTRESELFHQLRQQVSARASDLLRTARALAELDVFATLAEVAVRRAFVRPDLVDEDVLELRGGRHPVVEAHGASFVPNDVDLGEPGSGDRTIILTGPNMSGKSTYLRQIALIVLLAQIGSFVPARAARMGLCDRIFARIGAKDELALGQSTFMVEMVESAYILHHASARSLVILDEVGRGTSTFDGLAIAWAMAERLAEVGAKTLFATHYHQLNVLAEQWSGVANYRVSVEERGDDVVWTHRVLPGGTDRSYGIHVARMAGVPPSVLKRAEAVLADLEGKDTAPKVAVRKVPLQLTLFEAEEPELVRELRDTDVNALTPLQALQLLDRWKQSVQD